MRQLHVHASKRGTVCDDDGETVAIISGGVDSSPEDWAKLFAAAPDMRAVLPWIANLAEEAIEARKASDDDEDHEMIDFFEEKLREARAAIAKAGDWPCHSS